MTPEVYRVVREQCCDKLRQFFDIVATPIEGPEKKDFGDLDFFVALSNLNEYPPEKPAQVAIELLGAVRHKMEQAKVVAMAIPYPEELHTGSETPQYIQVDVHIYQDHRDVEWMLFKHAHGDLWNLLGSSIRHLGLTVDEQGLWVRIQEVEHQNKKLARVLLTRKPSEILEFLGLAADGGQWTTPFKSKEDLFEYAASCRFFWVRPARSDEDATGGSETDKAKLKANDRRRMKQRPLFRQWTEEFMPKCREEGRFSEPRATREQVREEAFERFIGSREAYDARLLAWQIQRQRETLWNGIIKPSLPDCLEQQYRSLVASALKKIILNGDTSFIIQAPADLKDADGLFNEDKVRDWVLNHWKAVGDAAAAIHAQRFAASKAKKESTDTKRTVSGSKKVADETVSDEKVSDEKATDEQATDEKAKDEKASDENERIHACRLKGYARSC
ncbi:Uu.00g013660.m01.CDS01 [Anthostomella pinea]|uniref:Uu.00g013660.m01.CDS01 n=1 Tax=Anthostomella pinea TaxID=933095 RepID=A0AAI8YN08_9PEZI|nr:Uu.00g013660.m01.CDS01 [Anthostomella pinea]